MILEKRVDIQNFFFFFLMTNLAVLFMSLFCIKLTIRLLSGTWTTNTFLALYVFPLAQNNNLGILMFAHISCGQCQD